MDPRVKPAGDEVQTERTSTIMKENVKRVFYVRQTNHPFLDIVAQRPEIRIDKLENDSPDADVAPIIGAAHAYQIGSARPELNPRLPPPPAPLPPDPGLLPTSTRPPPLHPPHRQDRPHPRPLRG